MSRLTIIGLLSWLGGLVILGFQGISTLMYEGTNWENMNLTDIIDPQYLEWIKHVPAFLHGGIDYMMSMPLFILLFCVGTISFIVNAFVE